MLFRSGHSLCHIQCQLTVRHARQMHYLIQCLRCISKTTDKCITDSLIKITGSFSVIINFLCVLASYAVKCDIPEDELFTDAFSLLQFLDDMSDDEHNRFTKRDILDAMQFYQENYVTYSRREAERVSAIAMPASKRNGRKQAEHLERARLVQTLDYPNGAWRNKEGRPKGSGEKSKIVEEWKQQHPDGKKIDCERETGLSRHTVLKWWK